MANYCLVCDSDAVSSMVHSAEKVFKDECGDYPHYYLQDEKGYFNTCMDVVEDIVSSLFTADCLNYFVSLKESRYNCYFGGNESE